MSTMKWIDEIRSAMDGLDAVEMDEGHRKTVFRCLRSELVEAIERRDEQEQTERDGKRWTEEELQVLRDTLTGRVAKKWEEERMNVTEVALKLRRNEKVAKKKAIELGLGAAVDYWVNREA